MKNFFLSKIFIALLAIINVISGAAFFFFGFSHGLGTKDQTIKVSTWLETIAVIQILYSVFHFGMSFNTIRWLFDPTIGEMDEDERRIMNIWLLIIGCILFISVFILHNVYVKLGGTFYE